MNISVEISMYPLIGDYIPEIDAFLEKLHQTEGIKVLTNNMSTQVFGEVNLVWDTLKGLIQTSYSDGQQIPFVMKVLHTDVSENHIPAYK